MPNAQCLMLIAHTPTNLRRPRSVLAMRCSLDRQLLAIQRSRVLIELVDLATGNITVHGR
jgi:hypothetical protein